MLKKTTARFQAIYNEFPSQFWVLVGASFVDRVGATLFFPFFTLYVTDKFNVGMTQAGMLLGFFNLSGMVGNVIGGALADRFGRKAIVLFGLIVSALSALTMGFVERMEVFYLLALTVGLLSDVAGPAWQAMIADILPEEKRTEGFGVMRVMGNMAWIIGPTIGGIIASRSFLTLFILDAIASLITAAIILRRVSETRPELAEGEKEESLGQTMVGYGKVLTDRAFMGYILASIAMTLVYIQMYNSLSVYLRDVHGVSAQGYGFVLTTSAITVILFQFWVSRQVKNYPPMLMMALGAAFYMVGFSMYGFVSAYLLFLAAMVVITIGEMIVMPTSQALAANFAPADMRGRYLAAFGLSWAIPSIIGPTAAGIVIDNYNPNWVWYIGGLLCFVSVISFLVLQRTTRQRFAPQIDADPAPQI
jgi:MFS family permease